MMVDGDDEDCFLTLAQFLDEAAVSNMWMASRTRTPLLLLFVFGGDAVDIGTVAPPSTLFCRRFMFVHDK